MPKCGICGEEISIINDENGNPVSTNVTPIKVMVSRLCGYSLVDGYVRHRHAAVTTNPGGQNENNETDSGEHQETKSS